MKLQYTALLCTALSLSACGFHPKGAGSSIAAIRLQPAETDTVSYTTLTTALKENRIRPDDNAPWTAAIGPEQVESTKTASGSSSTREVELRVSYALALRCANQPAYSTTISSRTNIEYISSEYIGSLEQAKAARAQLARDNADAAIRYINAITSAHSCPSAP